MSEDVKVKHELAKLREPFKENQISKLPKGTKAQNECKAEEKINCKVCGGWHHPRIIHLDYVGHAALTDRLLDVDPFWNWEPVAVDAGGYPLVDKDGGMWIRLSIHGITRLGYGDAQGKIGANATKERIGDALRNAAMRFGAALDLWHKGDLHVEDEGGHVPRLVVESPKLNVAGSIPAPPAIESPAGYSPHSDERNEWGDVKTPDGDIVILYIEEIEKKEGVNSKTKKPWTSWTLKVGNGKWGTFSGSVAKLAEEAKAAGKPVEVSYTIKEFAPGKFSNEIVTLKVMDDDIPL